MLARTETPKTPRLRLAPLFLQGLARRRRSSSPSECNLLRHSILVHLVQKNVNRLLVHERQEPLVERKHVIFAHSYLFKDTAVTSADEELVRTIWVPNLFRLQEQKLGKLCICHVDPPLLAPAPHSGAFV
jgi:hypothetical protein